MEGMHISDFWRLLDRNKIYGRYLRFYESKTGFENTVSIVDFSLPRRAKETRVKDDNWMKNEAYFRSCFVCNFSAFNSYIPMADEMGDWNQDKTTWIKKPARGIISTVRQLLSNSCIHQSPEIEKIVSRRDFTGMG